MKTNTCIILTVLCLLVCFAGSACSAKPTEPHITDPTVQSENTAPSENTVQGGNAGNTETPPGYSIHFYSVADIPKFISAVNAQETYFPEYAHINVANKALAANCAKKFAENCSDIKLICPPSDIIIDEFAAKYSVQSNIFRVYYIIDGIFYSFIYQIGSTNTPIQRNDEPVLRNVKVGSFELDLYQGSDHHLVGSFVMDGKTNIIITAGTVNPGQNKDRPPIAIDDVNYDIFTIIDLSKQPQVE